MECVIVIVNGDANICELVSGDSLNECLLEALRIFNEKSHSGSKTIEDYITRSVDRNDDCFKLKYWYKWNNVRMITYLDIIGKLHVKDVSAEMREILDEIEKKVIVLRAEKKARERHNQYLKLKKEFEPENQNNK